MEQAGKRKEVLDKLKAISSPAPSDWREKAQWRVDNRDWLRISGSICVYVMLNQENPREFVKEKLGCSDEYVEKFIHGQADLRISEIIKLVGFEEFLKTLNRLKEYRHSKNETE